MNRRELFRDGDDYERYIRMLAEAVRRYEWILLGFSLLPNHVHLVIETPRPNLGAGMQWLHSLYAATFNERWGLRGEGHVFQGPYGSKRVRDDLYFMRVSAYVLANAAAAGLCERPEDWPWASLSVSGRKPRPSWLAHDLLLKRYRELTGEDPLARMIW